jgi:hypothetical protein
VWPSSKRVPQPPLGGPRRLVAAPIQNLPVAAPPSAGCSKRTRRGHSACSTRFPVDAAERSRWVAVLTCFDRHTKPVQTGSRTAISQTYEPRCSRPPDDDRRSVDDARGAGQHLYGCWRHRGEGGLGWERILRKTAPGPVPGPAVIRHRCRGSRRRARRRSTSLHQGLHLRGCRLLGRDWESLRGGGAPGVLASVSK